MHEDLAELESALGHRFTERGVLLRALTHRSLANDRTVSGANANGNGDGAAGDNERLEFLGDAVLGLVVAEALFRSHSGWQEGELTRVRAQLVGRQHMAEVARAIDLGRHLRLSRAEERTGLRAKSTVLSNAMEAVLAALFLDGGLPAVEDFARRHIMGAAEEQLALELQKGEALGNFKSALQEKLQSERAGMPVYAVRSESGPDHRKRFLVEVRIKTGPGEPEKTLARGVGGTKKLAEQHAARRALEKLAKQGAGAQAASGGTHDEEQVGK